MPLCVCTQGVTGVYASLCVYNRGVHPVHASLCVYNSVYPVHASLCVYNQWCIPGYLRVYNSGVYPGTLGRDTSAQTSLLSVAGLRRVLVSFLLR